MQDAAQDVLLRYHGHPMNIMQMNTLTSQDQMIPHQLTLTILWEVLPQQTKQPTERLFRRQTPYL